MPFVKVVSILSANDVVDVDDDDDDDDVDFGYRRSMSRRYS